VISAIPMKVIFKELEFEEFNHPLSSKPAYRMRFGPHEVEALVLINRWFRESFMLCGTVNTGRTIGSIEGELPLEGETKEQGLALLSYFLASHVPEQFKPPWLRIGERMGMHLPWRRSSNTRQIPSDFTRTTESPN
jgi:hypothetical protein